MPALSMLCRLRLQFGAHEGRDPVEISPGPMTVIVGPNNSGKSMMLRELEQYIHKGEMATADDRHIIGEVVPAIPHEGPLPDLFIARIKGLGD